MADVYNIKINKIKFFFNKKNYYGMNRKDYLHRLMQENPQDYKKYIITEYSDEIIVYTTWYLLLLILSAILIIFSILELETSIIIKSPHFFVLSFVFQ